MQTARLAAILLTLGMFSVALPALAQQGGYYGPPPQRYGQQPYAQQPWESIPSEFRLAQQRGFQDGIQGARRDYQNHRPPNVDNRDEFRNPHFIPGPDRRDYRFGFKRGYEIAAQHIYGPGPR